MNQEVWVLIIERKAVEPRTIVSLHASEEGAKKEWAAYEGARNVIGHDIEKQAVHS